MPERGQGADAGGAAPEPPDDARDDEPDGQPPRGEDEEAGGADGKDPGDPGGKDPGGKDPGGRSSADGDGEQESSGREKPEDAPQDEDEGVNLGDRERERRLREERRAGKRARSNLGGDRYSAQNLFSGVRVEGGVHFSQGAADADGRPATGIVSPGELAWIRSVYVEPPGDDHGVSVYGEAERVLRAHSVLVLAGERGWGKATMALRLLAGRPVRRLSPELDLRRLDVGDLEPDCGYVIDALWVDGGEPRLAFELRRLGEELRDHGACLIVTVNRKSWPEGLEHLRGGLLVECADPPDEADAAAWKAAMLRRHLEVMLGERVPGEHDDAAPGARDTDPGQDSDPGLDPTSGPEQDTGPGQTSDSEQDTDVTDRDPDVTDLDPERLEELLGGVLVQQHLRRTSSPGEVVDLATLVAEVARGLLTESEAAERMADGSRARAQAILGKLGGNHELAFAVALAVLNGESYQLVLDAAAPLERRLDDLSGLQEPETRPVLGLIRSARLAKLEAVPRRDGTETTLVGTLPVEVVEFRNPRLPAALVEVVWDECDRARPAVIDWLVELAGDDEARLRASAGAALGRLSTFDFRHVHDTALFPLACGHRAERVVAAQALAVPAKAATHAAQVLRLLKTWTRRPSAPELLATAAVAYGDDTGARFPEQALKGLRRIADVGALALTMPVVDALANLYEAGAAQRYLVLEALVAWTTPEGDSPRRRRGIYGFLQIAFSVWTGPPGETDRHGTWPGLLAAADSEERRDRTMTLWRRALDLGDTGDLALNALRRWIRAGDTDRAVRERIVAFVRALLRAGSSAERERQRLRLRPSSQQLASGRRPSTTAQRLLDLEELQ